MSTPSTPFYRLLGQIFCAVQTWDEIPDVKEVMSKVGMTKDEIDDGRRLVEEGEQLVERRLEEAGGDRIAGHGVHQAAAELDMWVQTVRVQLRDRVDDPEVLELAVDHGLHSHDHTTTVIAGAFRTLGVLRTDPRIEEAYDRRRSLHDLIVRGQTLLAKLFDCTDVMVEDRSTGRRTDVFETLRKHHRQMDNWMVELSRCAENVKEHPQVLGLIGYLPDDVGLPAGGTSFAVPRHKRAQHDEPPDPDEQGSTSGWSAGRQGRNRENLGGGFVEPEFT